MLSVASLAFAVPVSAQIYKCESNGAIAYQQEPCVAASGKAVNAGRNTAGASPAPPSARPSVSTSPAPDVEVNRPRPGASLPAAARTCDFPWKNLPKGTKVLAGSSFGNGEDAGFPIDTSGSNAAYRDVVVDQPNVDVALLLSMSGANIWRISWTPGTRIVAVWASGNDRQAVVGLPRSTPLLMSDKDSPCGVFNFGGEQFPGAQVAAGKAFGLPLSAQFTAQYGRTVIGAAYVRKEAELMTSRAVDARTYELPDGYRYGRPAMARLERDGYIRRAQRREFQAWKDGWRRTNGLAAVPPDPYPETVLAYYVMVRPFEFPKRLHGSHSIDLIVPAGLKPPTGDPGHSVVYSMDGFRCTGPGCPRVEDERRASAVQARSGPPATSPAAPSPPASAFRAKAANGGPELIQVTDFWIRGTGKWYFEVSYDVGAVAREMKDAEAYVLIGCVTGKQPHGFVGRIGQEHKNRLIRHVSIAIDFDKRLIAERSNGEWLTGDPAEEGGSPFPSDGTTLCGVMSTASIRSTLRQVGVMQVNWGDRPFKFLPPPGFKPYGQGLVF
jgi:hypothetical protein